MSGKRFGGTFSPGGKPAGEPGRTPPPPETNRFRGRKAANVDIRAMALFVLPTPLLFAALGALQGGAAVRMVVLLAAYASLMLGAWLVRGGLAARTAFEARAIARPPAFPRLMTAAGLAGAGVFLAAMLGSTGGGVLTWGGNLLTAALFGGLAAGAHVVSFGLDPMKAKGVGNYDQRELDRVADALDKAETKLRAIEAEAHKLRDREIDSRVTALNATVRQMIALVEEDPRDLSRARRYLGVYLKGAEDATRKYAANHERLADPAIRTDYLALLSDLQASFERGKETLLLDDRTDLEVEIEVLRDRLGQEGA